MLANTPATRFQLMFAALKVKHPKLAQVSALHPLAIAQHEEGADFTKPLAVNAHNLFGMKYPAGRVAAGISTAVGQTSSGFAQFRSFYASIDDFMDWLEFRGLFSDAALDAYIKSGAYCPDKGYYAAHTKLVNALAPTMLDMPALALETALGGTALALGLAAVAKVIRKAS